MVRQAIRTVIREHARPAAARRRKCLHNMGFLKLFENASIFFFSGIRARTANRRKKRREPAKSTAAAAVTKKRTTAVDASEKFVLSALFFF